MQDGREMARGDVEAGCARPDLAAEHMQPIQAREF